MSNSLIRATHLALAPLALFVAGATAAAQTIVSEQVSYPAGETAVLKGDGFVPGETVALQVQHAGCPTTALGGDHYPWWVQADAQGKFTTDWGVCAGGCVGHTLTATAYSEATDTVVTEFEDVPFLPCGQAVASVTSGGTSCVEFLATAGSGPDVYAVAEGGSYFLTLSGVTECAGNSLRVLAQGINTSNICFDADRVPGTNDFVGEFTLPAQACNSYTIKYRCGSDCIEAGAVDARGPVSACGGVQLQVSLFDSNCILAGPDTVCEGCNCSGEPQFLNVVGQTIDLGCNPAVIPGCDPSVTAYDDCGPVEVTCGFNEGPLPGCRRGRRVVYTANNACGSNKVDVLYLWKVDAVAPTFVNPPSSIDLGCNPLEIPGASIVTATGNCNPPPTVTSSISDSSDGCSRTRAITYTATDACSNQAVHVQYVVWKVDTTAPTIDNAPGNQFLGCNPAVIPGPADVTASDDCGSASVTSTVSDLSTSNCSRSRTITYTATDGCGNQSTAVQVITWTEDTTPPVFNNTPGDIALGCNPASIPGPSVVTANDNCSGASVTTTSSDSIVGCIRTRTFKYTATDGCGNQSVHNQLVTWTSDTTAPTFDNAPGDVDLGCNPASIPGPASVTASDNCGGAVSVTSTQYDSSYGCDKKRKITYKATDACGNVKTHVQYIRWIVDTTPPTIHCCAPDITVAAGGACSKTVNFCYYPSTSDNCNDCDVDIIPPTQPSGGYPIGTTNVVWTARDGCGNTTTCTSKVKVLGRITATKFYDSNANGTRDSGEPGVDGWKIQVRQGLSLIATGYTNSSGNAYFNVAAGTYTVSECTPQQNNWVATRPTSTTAVVSATNCDATALFGNYCYEYPCDGLTINYWCSYSGQCVLNSSSNFPAWAHALNASNLRKSNGSQFTVSTTSKSSAISALNSWLAGASTSNMAYMLSAQLASVVLNVTCHQGLKDTDKVVVKGGVKTGNTCIVSFLTTSQSISCGSPLLSLTSVPGSSACGCSTNNAMVTIGDLRARAVCLLGAYSSTTSSSTQRTYQDCVKSILDMINNDGNPSGSGCYSCGGISHYINAPGACCDPSF